MKARLVKESLNEGVTPGTNEIFTVEDASYDIALYATREFVKDDDMRKFRTYIEKVIEEYIENLESLDDSGYYDDI